MVKPVKKARGLLRRFLWQPIPWYGKLLAPIVVLALALQLLGWVMP